MPGCGPDDHVVGCVVIAISTGTAFVTMSCTGENFVSSFNSSAGASDLIVKCTRICR